MNAFVELSEAIGRREADDRAGCGPVEAWLSEEGVQGVGPATRMYDDYVAWSGCVERRPQHAKLGRRRVPHDLVAPRLIVGSRQGGLARLRMAIETAFEGFAVHFDKRGKHDHLHQVGEREVLGHQGCQGSIEIHRHVSSEIDHAAGARIEGRVIIVRPGEDDQ